MSLLQPKAFSVSFLALKVRLEFCESEHATSMSEMRPQNNFNWEKVDWQLAKLPLMVFLTLLNSGCIFNVDKTADPAAAKVANRCFSLVHDSLFYKQFCPDMRSSASGDTFCDTVQIMGTPPIPTSEQYAEDPADWNRKLLHNVDGMYQSLHRPPADDGTVYGVLRAGTEIQITKVSRFQRGDLGVWWMTAATIAGGPFSGRELIIPSAGFATPSWLIDPTSNPIAQFDPDRLQPCSNLSP
jgi:hypothetical protein